MIVAVIEWHSDSAEQPWVCVADGEDAARRAVAEMLIPHVPHGEDEGSINYLTHSWAEENPPPDLDDAAAVHAWLGAIREATTDAWLELYGPGMPYSYSDVRVSGQ